MAERSIIAWTDNTFNPWMGCTKVSPGCKNCYAETLTRNRMGIEVWGPSASRQLTAAGTWSKPWTWNRQAEKEGRRLRVFCASLCDWAEEWDGQMVDAKDNRLWYCPTDPRREPRVCEGKSGSYLPADNFQPFTLDTARSRLWDLIRITPHLDWQLLTKRSDRIASLLPADWGEGYPNVWLGVSVENNDYTWRADCLRTIPATVRFISYEPALGPLDRLDLAGLDWIIYGGESGPGYRPENKQWARDMRDRCQAAGTAFFHKQSSGHRTEMGIELDGRIVREYPSPRLPLPILFA